MSREVSTYKKLMASIRKDISKAKMKGKKVKSECCHHGKKSSKWWIKEIKGQKNKFRCSECHSKLDFGELAKVGDDRQKLKKFIKKNFKTIRNLFDIAKLMHNYKDDAKIIKYISETEFAMYRLEDYLIAMIVDQFEPKRKKHRKGKNKSTVRITGGGRSLGNFK
jgi:hypothetical protein